MNFIIYCKNQELKNLLAIKYNKSNNDEKTTELGETMVKAR